MTESTQTRSTADAVSATLRQAGSTAVRALDSAQGEVRRHRQEMLILGGTLLFVLVVAALALTALLG